MTDIGLLQKNARLMRGLSMDALVKKMSNYVSKQTISNYERGAFEPSREYLQKLSEALLLPKGYFDQETSDIKDVQLRDDGRIGPKERRMLEARMKAALAEYLRLENNLCIISCFSNPISSIIVHDKDDAEKAAAELRKAWTLGTFAIPFLCDVVENAGIIMLEMDGGLKDFFGLCGRVASNNRPFIALESTQTTERYRFTVAHELGHLLMNISPEAENVEKLCHRFAAAFLLAPDAVIKEFGDYRKALTMEELISVKNRYGVSVASIVHRLYDLGIINRRYYDYMYDEHINKNRMEEGWGGYPINDRPQLQTMMKCRAASMGIEGFEKSELVITVL